MTEPIQIDKQAEDIVVEQSVTTVDLSTLLAADFAYISQTAFQAAEDRARTTTFYLLSIGSVLATVFAANLDNVDPWRTALAFSIVFGAMSMMGIITLMQLARLRTAWFSSVEAMNHIKEFALEHTVSDTYSRSPFPWMNQHLPERFELKSVGAFLLFQVVIMASVMFGACIFHIGLLINMQQTWIVQSFIGGILWSILGTWSYFWALQKR